MHVSALDTGELLESIKQHNNYSGTRPIGFKDLRSGKIFSFDCSRRIDRQFAEEKRSFILEKLSQADFQFGNYSEDEALEPQPQKEVFRQVFGDCPAKNGSGFLEETLPRLREMQTNLHLCKLSPTCTDAHLLLNEQINASINRELSRRGIRVDELNAKRLDQIIRRQAQTPVESGRESEFDPFYYYKTELDLESVAHLKSNDWQLHVDFKEHHERQEEVYAAIVEQLSGLTRELRDQGARLVKHFRKNRRENAEQQKKPGKRGFPGDTQETQEGAQELARGQ